jgi:hypothetical protein
MQLLGFFKQSKTELNSQVGFLFSRLLSHGLCVVHSILTPPAWDTLALQYLGPVILTFFLEIQYASCVFGLALKI